MILNLLKNEKFEEFFKKILKNSNKDEFCKNMESLMNEISQFIQENIEILINKKKFSYKKDLISFVGLLTKVIKNLNNFFDNHKDSFCKINRFSKKLVLQMIMNLLQKTNFLNEIFIEPWVIFLNDNIDLNYYHIIHILPLVQDIVSPEILKELRNRIINEIKTFITNLKSDSQLDMIDYIVTICDKILFISEINENLFRELYINITSEKDEISFANLLLSKKFACIINFLKLTRLLENQSFSLILTKFTNELKEYLKQKILENNNKSIEVILLLKKNEDIFFSQNLREVLSIINFEEYSFKSILKSIKKVN